MLVRDQAKVLQNASADRAAWPEIRALQDIGSLFYSRGWSVGTSSNYSVVLGRDPLRLLITASGKDKRSLAPTDFLIIGESGAPAEETEAKPSAETLLHVVAAQQNGIGAVLHTHSVWATLLSDHFFKGGGMAIEGYEMLKGLSGVTTHEHKEWIPIFNNTQDIPALAKRVRAQFADEQNLLTHGFLIRNHGLYTWGRDLAEARRHIEIFEFLFEVVGRKLTLAQR